MEVTSFNAQSKSSNSGINNTNTQRNNIVYDLFQADEVDELQQLHEASFPIKYGAEFYKAIQSGSYQNIPIYCLCAYGYDRDQTLPTGRSVISANEMKPHHNLNSRVSQDSSKQIPDPPSSVCKYTPSGESYDIGNSVGTEIMHRDIESDFKRCMVGNILAQLCSFMQGEGTNDLLSGESQARGLITCCYVLTVAVDERFKRQRIATNLLEQCIAHADLEPSCGVVYLHVVTYNKEAVKFYEKNGFTYLKLCQEFYSINNKPYDAYLYAKYLKGATPPRALVLKNVENVPSTSGFGNVINKLLRPIMTSFSTFMSFLFSEQEDHEVAAMMQASGHDTTTAVSNV